MTPANNKIETSMNLTTHQHTHLHTHSRMRELSRGWLGKPTNLILSSYKSGGNKAEQSTCVGQAGKDHRQQSLVEKDFIPALLHSCHSFVPLWWSWCSSCTCDWRTCACLILHCQWPRRWREAGSRLSVCGDDVPVCRGSFALPRLYRVASVSFYFVFLFLYMHAAVFYLAEAFLDVMRLFRKRPFASSSSLLTLCPASRLFLPSTHWCETLSYFTLTVTEYLGKSQRFPPEHWGGKARL